MQAPKFLVALAIFFSPVTSFASDRPSFDCEAAQTDVEIAICANHDLAAYDTLIAEMYSRALDRGETTAEAQRAWIVKRDACGQDVTCLDNAHIDRLNQLTVLEERIMDAGVDFRPIFKAFASCTISADWWAGGFSLDLLKHEPDTRTDYLLETVCYLGAYNIGSRRYILSISDDQPSGEFTRLMYPVMDYEYETHLVEGEDVLDSFTVLGPSTIGEAVNSEYIPEDKTITSLSKSRGIGDCYSIHHWVIDTSDYGIPSARLTYQEIDPTCDGQRNGIVVFDESEGWD